MENKGKRVANLSGIGTFGVQRTNLTKVGSAVVALLVCHLAQEQNMPNDLNTAQIQAITGELTGSYKTSFLRPSFGPAFSPLPCTQPSAGWLVFGCLFIPLF